MTNVPFDAAPQNHIPFRDKLTVDNRYRYGIPAEQFIEYYQVGNPEVQTVLRQNPTLCYLLGRVTPEQRTLSNVKEKKEESIHILTEGSGMFNLENKDDAMRWRGIFNHILGTARQVYYLATRLNELTPQQKQQFADLGFDINSFNDIDPELIRDFMFISHAGRRQSDEKTWHQLNDNAHQDSNPGTATIKYLREMKANQAFIDLMRLEMHVDHLVQAGKNALLPHAADNVYCYADWTFSQIPNSLADRFTGLRNSQRESPETLALLEQCGNNFEAALKQIVNPSIWQEMTSAGPYDWETQIRQAYCAPSGLTLQEVFPLYVKQFPQAGK